MQTITREPRPEKVAVVDEVEARLTESSAAILTEYRGIPVAQLEALRRALTAAGGDYKIYKNTLVRRAARATGHDVIEPLLVGPTAIAFVRNDVSAVAKVLRDFARTNPNLVVKGGLIGKNMLDASGAAALAELPSRDALLAQIAGLLAAPMQRFAGLLAALPQNLAYGLSALIDSRGGVGEVAPPSDEVADTVAEAADVVEGAETNDTVEAPQAQTAEADTAEAPQAVETPDTAEATEADAATDTAETDTADSDTAEADTAETDTAETDTAEADTADSGTAETDTAEAPQAVEAGIAEAAVEPESADRADASTPGATAAEDAAEPEAE